MGTTTPQFKVKLSCNHVIILDETVEAGTPVECPRCTASAGLPRNRRAKKVTLIGPSPADEVDAAEARIAELAQPEPVEAEQVVTEGLAPDDEDVAGRVRPFHTHPYIADRGDEGHAHRERGRHTHVTASGADDYDVTLASAEWKALKAWRDGGRVGPQPATSNFEAMLAANAAGKPRSGKARKAGTARVVNPRRQQANDARKAKGFEGRTGRKVTAEELDAYIRKVRAEHPDSSREDELEVAYWDQELAVSRGRWGKAWAAAEAPQGDAQDA